MPADRSPSLITDTRARLAHVRDQFLWRRFENVTSNSNGDSGARDALRLSLTGLDVIRPRAKARDDLVM